MTDHAGQLTIRSQYGMLRDLVPIYSLHQLFPNLVGLALALWLVRGFGHLPPIALLIPLSAWLFQYVARPCVMHVSDVQTEWLEDVLAVQGYYERSEADGRWRTIGKQWWQRWPHQFIEFVPGPDAVTLVAPRDVMESIRVGFELMEEHDEVWFADSNQPFTFEPPEPEPLPWHVHVPSALLGAACVLAWIWCLFSDGMAGWGVSGLALSQGRFETILLHMFAHGGALHLWMNMTALAAIGGALVARLGPTPLNWLRFLLLFVLSGLAGAASYLALHPAGTVPMLGASGALYGLFGLLIRAPADGGALLSVRSGRIRRIGWDLVKQNAFLFGLLALLSWSQGGAGGLAWEAHLGGFLFGLFVGPKFLPRTAREPEMPDDSPPALVQGG